MTRTEIISKLNEIVEDIIDEGTVSLTETTTAKEVQGWDSLNNIQIIVAIERSLDIKFSSDEMLSWNNIADMLNSIEVQLNTK